MGKMFTLRISEKDKKYIGGKNGEQRSPEKAVDLLSDELSEYVEAERLRGMLRSVGMSEK